MPDTDPYGSSLTLDLLTFLLPILIKVPVEVRSVLLPTFALTARVLIYTLRIKNL
jgi:hypothetical protein